MIVFGSVYVCNLSDLYSIIFINYFECIYCIDNIVIFFMHEYDKINVIVYFICSVCLNLGGCVF